MQCQKCRLPLVPPSALDDSLAALSPSAYDIISASLSDRHLPLPSDRERDLSRLPPSLRPLYTAASAYPSPSARSPSVRVTHPYATPPPPQRQYAPHNPGPGESFVVLTESVVGRARTASASAASTSNAGGSHSLPYAHHESLSSSEAQAATQPLTPRLAQLATLYNILSGTTPVDHPLCAECMEALLGLMARELEEGRKERDRLVAFEREVARRREEGGAPGKELLRREIAKVRKVEKQAVEELKAIEAERELLEQEKRALDAEEAEVALEEEAFWRDHSAYLLQAATLRDRNNSLMTRYEHDVRQLDKLQKTNVYNDAFCIGHEAGFGTINGLRLGRLPGVPVEWPEINAAWGHTLLLLHTIARKFGFAFDSYRLVPMGSFSRIEKTSGDKATYELYGSGDFNAVTRIFQNRRFDLAMVAFLDCLRQVMEFVKTKDKTVKLPHAVVKDKIGDVSIKYQFGTDEAWTRALRHVLFDLKILLARASL